MNKIFDFEGIISDRGTILPDPNITGSNNPDIVIDTDLGKLLGENTYNGWTKFLVYLTDERVPENDRDYCYGIYLQRMSVYKYTSVREYMFSMTDTRLINNNDFHIFVRSKDLDLNLGSIAISNREVPKFNLVIKLKNKFEDYLYFYSRGDVSSKRIYIKLPKGKKYKDDLCRIIPEDISYEHSDDGQITVNFKDWGENNDRFYIILSEDDLKRIDVKSMSELFELDLFYVDK